MKIALIQMNSGNDMAANIAAFEAYVAEAAGQGAELVATPENTFMMDSWASGDVAKPTVRYTQDSHPGIQAAAEAAQQHGVWILVGGVAVLPDLSPSALSRGSIHNKMDARVEPEHDNNKTYNRSLLFNPQGQIAASYDKVHLFDVDVGDGQAYVESARYLAGEKPVVAEIVGSGGWTGNRENYQEARSADRASPEHRPMEFSVENSGGHQKNTPHPDPPPQGGRGLNVKLGLSICYDVRFPYLYRRLAMQGAQILTVPAAFVQITGEAHWHVLLRARAIENGCFVIAPAQTGSHPGGRKTFGHSLVIDPWGRVLADGGEAKGVVIADIDLTDVEKTRAKIPSLSHCKNNIITDFSI